MANKLITVATFDHINQASLIQQWLDSAGIESYLLDHGMSVEAAMHLDGNIELQVVEKYALKALELIETMKNHSRENQDTPSITTIKKILVPVDFSSNSLNATYYALHVALQKKAEITLIHVYFNPVTDPIAADHFYPFPTSIADTLTEIIDNARNSMRDFRTKVNDYMTTHKLSNISINSELIGGIAEDTILDFAEGGFFNLIIMGFAGKKTGEGWLGSFISEIINKCQIPILAVPNHATYKESMFKRLMYATNFDKSDGNAIRELLKIAKPLEVHISVVHIDETDNNPFINYDLIHFKEKYQLEGSVDMDFNLIVNKNLSLGIENYISEHKIDILAVTSHKRNILTSIFRPSLTKELLFRLEIPMLIFHS
jgi:nucleotide-binding universal stress UspA family protein